MTLSRARITQALDATWPAKATQSLGPWTIRDGDGGGQRVSSAIATGPVTDADIPQAEDAMRALGQDPLFCLRDGDEALDALLDARGYRLHDPVVLYAIPCAGLTDEPLPPVAAFSIWPPLAIMRDLWREGGIGPARLRVMERANAPKTGILARNNDQPAGAAFAACDSEVAMIHAIDVVFFAPQTRRWHQYPAKSRILGTRSWGNHPDIGGYPLK